LNFRHWFPLSLFSLSPRPLSLYHLFSTYLCSLFFLGREGAFFHWSASFSSSKWLKNEVFDHKVHKERQAFLQTFVMTFLMPWRLCVILDMSQCKRSLQTSSCGLVV
jgi:hypothetical protein